MNLNKFILKGGKVYINGKIQKLDIEIENGIIKQIHPHLKGENIIECHDKLITPSFIDPHVHFRSPGFEYKEDITTGSKAALKGGYGHVLEMPNTKPTLDNVETMKEHLNQLKKQAYINVTPFSAATKNLTGLELVDIESMAKLNIAGFSDDGKGIQNDEIMKELLIRAGKLNKLVSAHCEDESEFVDGMGSINLSAKAKENNDIGINNKSEWAMIKRDIDIIKEIHGIHNYQYHICHISTKESVQLLKEAKDKGFNVSGEVTPHHLISDDSEIDYNNANYKMNPPLRSKEDVNTLIKALNEGVIECIATDHAPHSADEKNQSIDKAPFGIIGLELAFSLLNTYLVKPNKVQLETILKALIDNPARIFKIEAGIAINKEAHLNIIDLDKEVIYTKSNLVSKANNTFYLNRKLNGKIETSIQKEKIYNW